MAATKHAATTIALPFPSREACLTWLRDTSKHTEKSLLKLSAKKVLSSLVSLSNPTASPVSLSNPAASPDCCPICISPLSEPSIALHGQHIFCAACITKWLQSSNTCPICRTEIYIARRNSRRGRQSHHLEWPYDIPPELILSGNHTEFVAALRARLLHPTTTSPRVVAAMTAANVLSILRMQTEFWFAGTVTMPTPAAEIPPTSTTGNSRSPVRSLTRLSASRRIVDGRDLASALEEAFLAWLRSTCRREARGTSGWVAALHPLAWRAFSLVQRRLMETIDVEMTAEELEDSLEAAIWVGFVDVPIAVPGRETTGWGDMAWLEEMGLLPPSTRQFVVDLIEVAMRTHEELSGEGEGAPTVARRDSTLM